MGLRVGIGFLFAACQIIGLGWGSVSYAAKTIPDPPYYYVLDEPNVLDPSAKQALQSLLIEHDRLSGEQFLIAVFNSLDGEDVNDFTNRVFTQWAIGKRGKDNGVLLALYWQDRKFRIEVGYGLEPVLTDARSKDILTEFLVPGLKNNQPARALSLTALEILRTLESPLIASGQAEQILRGGIGKLHQANDALPTGPIPHGWMVWLFLGGILLVIVLNLLTSADAHFTRDGWFRSRPWQRYPNDRRGRGGGFWWGGGGGWGSSGGSGWGGGGFSGGGGSSGGGGASGSW